MIEVRIGDSRKLIKELPDKSIDCVVTSPPYWGLRDYKTAPIIFDGLPDCEHEWGSKIRVNRGHAGDETTLVGTQTANLSKSVDDLGSFCSLCGAWRGQLGLEPTPELFIKHLLDFFDDVKLKLKDEGNCFVNLGDTYSGSGNGFGSIDPKNVTLCKSGAKNKPIKNNSYPAKCLCLIPQRFAIGMVERGWIIRNYLIWHKPNAMPSSAEDRFTVDYEPILFFTKTQKYYFDNDAVLEPYTKELNRWAGSFVRGDCKTKTEQFAISERRGRNMRPNEKGRNRRSVWSINTEPYPEAHFATFNNEVIKYPILAGCPEQVCVKCGKARRVLKRHNQLTTTGNEESFKLSDKPYAVQERDGDVEFRDLPPLNDLKEYLKEWRTEYTIDEIEAHFGTQAPHHWINGEAYPSKEDWLKLKELLGFDNRYDDQMTTIWYKPAKKMEYDYSVVAYTDCGCNAGFKPGTVLDPFAGSGTVGEFCRHNDRNAILFDLNPDYKDLMIRRCMLDIPPLENYVTEGNDNC